MMNLELLDRQTLLSFFELVHTQRQAFASLSFSFNIDMKWMLLSWLYRDCPQFGSLNGWSFFFHGYDCDLENSDGVRVVVDLGSLGTDDSFSRWSVASFIGSSGRNRFALTELRNLVRQEFPGQPIQISEEPVSIACDRLLKHGYLEKRSSIRSIEDIPKNIVKKYLINKDSFIFSIYRECLFLTAKGIEQVSRDIGSDITHV